MEGWLSLRDELDAQIVKNRELENGFAFDLDFSLAECGFDESKSRLRGMFNQVLVIFLKEMSVDQQCIRPLPVFCPDGVPVDLFKLFWVVNRVGGYDLVSRRNLWGFVAKECGLRVGSIASVKLIYIKYLNELDRWFRKGFRESSPEDDGSRVVKKLELLLQKLEEENRSLFCEGWKREKQEVKCDKTSNEIGSGHTSRLVLCSSNGYSKDGHGYAERKVNNDQKIYFGNGCYPSRLTNLIIQKMFDEVDEFSKWKFSSEEKYSCSHYENGVSLTAEKVIEKFISKVDKSMGSIQNSNGKGISVDTTNHVMSSPKNVVSVVPDSRKRKREASLLSDMLNWLLCVAKHPDDPAVGGMPECSKWKDEGDEEFWYKILLARKALLTKRCVNLNVEESSKQKKCRMHPSMYEDVVNHQSVDKSRCSQRLPVIKSHICSCCNSGQTKVANPQKLGAGSCPKESPVETVELSFGNKTDHPSMEEPCEKQVSVGPSFQAEVPDWTGEVFVSDSKWLGERVWPPEDAGDEMVIDLDPIGKGRPERCGCFFPEATECIRFHIAEKRLKLKHELGSLFYKWRFNHMGEEVSLSWTREEENKFKNMLSLHSESTNKFWNNATKLFPSKTREMLVSYYFNVFLIQRRNYQNRVTPKDIDSDDDEKEFGSVGDRFGYKAIHVPKSRLPICFENMQCADLE